MPLLAVVPGSTGAAAVESLMGQGLAGAVEIARPQLDQLPYAALVRGLLSKPGFRLDFGARSPAAALDLVADQLLGPGALMPERAAFAQDVSSLRQLMRGLADGPPPLVSLRSYFAPGDLVWHLDRMNGGLAYRLVWPIARPAGMAVTPADNIDVGMYRAYMRREHALLGRLDTVVGKQGRSIETFWAHRPLQLAAMTSGVFPFIKDRGRVQTVTPGHASIHRVDTPGMPGTYHRSSWANRHAPGLQLVITASSD